MFERATSYRPNLMARLLLVEDWKLTLNASRRDRIRLKTSVEEEIRCVDVTAVTTTKGLLWHGVEIRSTHRSVSLSGLTGKAAKEAVDGLLDFLNRHLLGLIESDIGQLRAVDAAITAMTDAKSRYLAQSDISRVIAGVPGTASQALAHPLFDAGRITGPLKGRLPTSIAMLIDPEVRKRYNEEFVQHELRSLDAFFADLGGISLSGEQREACIRLEDNNLLVASAGSGKSSTMVGKVAYVIEKGLYAPEEILVLAFNRDAAHELKERIARQQGVEEDALECRVTTFHALGRSIIQDVEGRPPQLANWVDHPAGEGRVIKEIIETLTGEDEEFQRIWIDLLSIMPKADIPRDAFENDEEYLRYIADITSADEKRTGTLAKINVASLQEQRIVNWLWTHSVDFQYERQIELEGEDGVRRFVKPDFFYPLKATYHEHFAIDADGTSPFLNYVEHAQSKRAGFAKGEFDFFETTSAQASDGTLLDALKAELDAREIPLVKKTPEEIMRAIRPVVITHYEKLVGICIKHIRASRLTLDMLLEKAKTLHDKGRAEHFARAVWKITEGYTRRLETDQRIDFDSMIGDAIRHVDERRYESPYSMILVDEFQDISEPRANLVKALKHQRPFTKVFAVGDDWQSIYRFAGSDITLFTDFEASFGTSWQGRLEQTYRCNQHLADAAARFVQKNPAQIAKSVRSTRPGIPKSIRMIPVRVEWGKPSFQNACFQMLDRLNAFLGGISSQWRTDERNKLKVLVLWRYNLLDPFRQRRPVFENIEVTGLSFHRSKGLEADYTILLDISEGDYGVPSRIEDDELLHLVIPRPETFEYAEERRLFYVALTRASRGAFLLYNQDSPSRYIGELRRSGGDAVRFETIDGKAFDPCPKCTPGRLVERRGPDGSSFIGCSRFPHCRHTQPAKERTAAAA